MGSFSDYTENNVLDHLTGKTAFTMPTAYIALSTTDPTDDASGISEPDSTGGYARITTSGSDWDAASGGATANATVLSFPVSTEAWSTDETDLAYFAVYDALSGGNMLGHGSLTTPMAVDTDGITLSFAIGDLDWTLT